MTLRLSRTIYSARIAIIRSKMMPPTTGPAIHAWDDFDGALGVAVGELEVVDWDGGVDQIVTTVPDMLCVDTGTELSTVVLTEPDSVVTVVLTETDAAVVVMVDTVVPTLVVGFTGVVAVAVGLAK